MEEEKIDMAIIQEPYTYKNEVKGIPYKTIYKETTDTPKTTIVIRNNNIESILLNDKSKNNITTIEMKTGSKKITVISAYIPPKARRMEEDKFNENIDELIEIIKSVKDKQELIIGMDSNSKSRMWGGNREDDRGRKWQEIIEENELNVENEGEAPTFNGHQGSSHIDVTLTNEKAAKIVKEWEIEEGESMTDHNYIKFNINQQENWKQTSATHRFCTKKADWIGFKQTLRREIDKIKEDIKQIKNKKEVEENARKYNEAIEQACTKNIPRQKEYKKSVAWWTKELDEKRKETRKLRRKAKKEEEKEGDDATEATAAYKEKEKEYKTLLKTTRERKFQEFCVESFSQDPWGAAYRVLYKNRKTQTINNIKRADGSYTENTEETINELLNNFFPGEEEEVREETENEEEENENDIPITKEEMNKTLEKMNPKKAPGEDGITADIARKVLEEAGEETLELYNKCLETETFPKVWKTQNIISLKKPNKTDRTDPKTYRPISLLPVMGKILDGILTDRIEYHTKNNNKTQINQYGFTKGKSTIDAIQHAIKYLKKAKEEKKYTTAIAMDIQGAFDTANRAEITKEMRRNKIPKNIVNITKSYLENRMAKLKIGETIAEKRTTQGCPQGSKSGPALWKQIYNTIFETELPGETQIISFADDTLILAKNKTYHGLKRQANEAMEKLNEWAESKKLKFNNTKTEAIYIGINNRDNRPTFKCKDQYIRCKTEMKYLGITINEKLTWKQHIDNTTAKASAMLNKLEFVAKKEWGIKKKQIKTIYDGAVEPAILYGAEIWGKELRHKEKRKIQGIQRRAAIRAIKAYKTVSTEAALALAGMTPTVLKAEERATIQDIKTADNNNIVQEIVGTATEKSMEQTITDHRHPAKRIRMKYENHKEEEDNQTEIVIYTDGSKQEERTGAGMVIYREGREMHSKKIKTNNESTVFQCELTAIREGLKYIERNRYGSATIATDSRSALEAIKNQRRTTKLLEEILTKIEGINNENKKIEWRWVKAHNGTKGNERADEIAKEANKEQRIEVINEISKKTIKQKLREKTRERAEEDYKKTENAAQTKKFAKTRKEAAEIGNIANRKTIQLITGHGNMASYLYKIGKRGDDQCPCGKGRGDADHNLYQCELEEEARARAEPKLLQSGYGWPRNNEETEKMEDRTSLIKAMNIMSMQSYMLQREGEEI